MAPKTKNIFLASTSKIFGQGIPTSKIGAWVWVKIKPPGDHRLESSVPFTEVSIWVPIFDNHSQIHWHSFPKLASNLTAARISDASGALSGFPFASWPRENWRRVNGTNMEPWYMAMGQIQIVPPVNIPIQPLK